MHLAQHAREVGRATPVAARMGDSARGGAFRARASFNHGGPCTAGAALWR